MNSNNHNDLSFKNNQNEGWTNGYYVPKIKKCVAPYGFLNYNCRWNHINFYLHIYATSQSIKLRVLDDIPISPTKYTAMLQR